MAVIGIDFGSSYSSASWINPKSGKAEPVVFRDNDVKLPSTMLFNNGGFLCGYQAESYLAEVNKLPPEYRLTMMQDFVPCLKGALSATKKEFFGDKEYSYTDLLATYFKYMVGLARQHCGSDYEITDVVFSHPVAFSEAKVAMMREAFERIGLKADHCRLEPVAAILGHTRRHEVKEGEGLLVFDFGGGTIDVAFVRKAGGKLRVSAKPRGDSHCGGNDLDYLVYEHFRNKIKQEFGGYDITRQGAVDFAILNICRKLKECFSGENDTYSIPGMIVVDGKMNFYNFTLSREAFGNIIYAKVADAVNMAKMVAKDAKENGYGVDRVLLIGGSSRLTLVSQLLAEAFPNAKLETGGERDIVVALGNIVDEQVDNANEQTDSKKQQGKQGKAQATQGKAQGKQEGKQGAPQENRVRLITVSQQGDIDTHKGMSVDNIDNFVTYNQQALKSFDIYLTYMSPRNYIDCIRLKEKHHLRCHILHELQVMAYGIPADEKEINQVVRLVWGDKHLDYSVDYSTVDHKNYEWDIYGQGNPPETDVITRTITADGHAEELLVEGIRHLNGPRFDDYLIDVCPFDVSIAILDQDKKYITGGLVLEKGTPTMQIGCESFPCGNDRTLVLCIDSEHVIVRRHATYEKGVFVIVSMNMKNSLTFSLNREKEECLDPYIYPGIDTGKPDNREPKDKARTDHAKAKVQASHASHESGKGGKPEPQVDKPQPVPDPRQAVLEHIKANMVLVEGGTFTMGHGEKPQVGLLKKLWDGGGVPPYTPAHQVKVSSFCISKFEVTQEEWLAFMKKFPAHRTVKVKGQPFISNFPMNDVTWNDCQTFIAKLNEFSHLAFRLPTEAEWEYAARGGKKSKGQEGHGTDKAHALDSPHASGLGEANELGIYDLTDNLLEWCLDWYGDYQPGYQVNPQGPKNGSRKVLRGLCTQVYYRTSQKPSRWLGEITAPNWMKCGFRLVLPYT